MASTAMIHGKETSLAILSPVTVGIYSADTKSLQMALYERLALSETLSLTLISLTLSLSLTFPWKTGRRRPSRHGSEL